MGLEAKISVLVSFAQEMVEEQGDYAHVVEQFTGVPELKRVYDKIQGRVFFLGAAQKKAIYGKEANDQISQNVHRQRDALFTHIRLQEDTFNVKDLQVYKKYLAFLKEIKGELEVCCRDEGNSQTCGHIDKLTRFIRQYMPTTPAEDYGAKDGGQHKEL